MKKQLISYSRQLRSNQTNAEKLLWQKLRKRQLGVRFQRQYIFDNKYIVDFYCAALKLVIEIDGGQHCDNRKDKFRNQEIINRGYKLLRFWNNDILENIEGCLSQITTLIPSSPPLNIKGRLGGVYASPELGKNEDASTGRRLQKTNAISNNEHPIPPLNVKGRLGGVYASPKLGKNEDASTERRLQKTNKIFVPLSVYIHWPYCLSKCPYCDFYSKIDKRVDQQKVIDGYLADLEWYHEITSEQTVQSIFFGGGTPSLIEPRYIEKIINHVHKLWPTTDNVEISLEANPNTNHPDLFADLKKTGINRLSLGVQALNNESLKFLGRTHNLTQALQAIEQITTIFDNHSIDLIYARPGQTPEAWQKELQQAVSFGLKHISLYQLTIEEGTFFARKGIKPLEDEPASQLYAITQQYLKKHGYPQYEISNFANPGYESRHNLAYWRGENYLGIGPAAHGRIKTKDKIYASTHHRQLEELTPAERAEELIIMGLRITEGINKKRFQQQCGLPLNSVVNNQSLETLKHSNLLIETPDTLRATPQGFVVLNKVIEDLCC